MGSIISIIAALLVLYRNSIYASIIKSLKLSTFITTLLLIFLVLFVYFDYINFLDNLAPNKYEQGLLLYLDELTNLRASMWYKSYIIASDSLFFGHTPDSFRLYNEEILSKYFVQLHNLALQTFFELGLMGSIIVLLFLLSVNNAILINLKQALPEDKRLINYSYSVFIAYIVYSMVDGVFYHAHSAVLIMIIISIGLSKPHNPRKIAVEPTTNV